MKKIIIFVIAIAASIMFLIFRDNYDLGQTSFTIFFGAAIGTIGYYIGYWRMLNFIRIKKEFNAPNMFYDVQITQKRLTRKQIRRRFEQSVKSFKKLYSGEEAAE